MTVGVEDGLLYNEGNMKRIAVIYGTYHESEAAQMRDAVRAEALAAGAEIVYEKGVPGSMEKPLATKRALMEENVDAVVVLGIIEKGETQHGLVMAQAVIRSLVDLQLEFMKPVGVGILGPDIQSHQIPPRLRLYAANALKAVCAML
ncbi:6,7-dimethyl-8-ribityllumazine synthase [Burkholderia mayonis]|uniref:6,7-dimethyl-8-ribityllumazine synthase n=1 Tax=Burkholderia mayonis TaxID=1385591 RepID=UPI000A9F2B8E|nr:6,7-dimethyl-8-ribityllumazine synthase [Burkholderia mayonis]